MASFDRIGRPSWGARRTAGGFTYIGVLTVIAVMGIFLAAAGQIWETAQQRTREAELIFIGHQFRRAIAAYYNYTPAGQSARSAAALQRLRAYPPQLEDLIKDPRRLQTSRYLRKMFIDPMTGKAEWGLLKGPDDRIMGVYSLSEKRPIKQATFDPVDVGFEGAANYGGWKFAYTPKLQQNTSQQPTLGPVNQGTPGIAPGIVAPQPAPVDNAK